MGGTVTGADGTEYTEEELQDLTQEERDAILANDEDLEAPDEDDDLDTGADDDSATQAAAGDDAGKPGDDAGGDDDAAAAKAAEEEAAAEAVRKAEEERQQQEQAKVPELDPAINERLGEISEERKKLADEYEDGEFTTSEYNEKLETLAKEERKLEFEIHDHEKAVEKMKADADAADEQEWIDDCKSFLDGHDGYKESPSMYNRLNEEVVALSKISANASLTNTELLEKAHQNVTRVLGIDPDNLKTKDDAGKPKQETKKEEEKKTPLDKANLPPDVGGLPASDATEAGNSEWAALDRLSGVDLENALAKMPEEKVEAYLAAR